MFLLSQDKILVPLLLLLVLLWLLLLLLLVPRRMMIMWEIMRMRLIKIRTTCNHRHHHHQVVFMHIIATVGLHPDIYLTWELETEQRFTCLQYPEERRVAVAVCAFTSFACVRWSEHSRLYPIPATWAALKTAKRTCWVPPYYQRELLQKLQR